MRPRVPRANAVCQWLEREPWYQLDSLIADDPTK